MVSRSVLIVEDESLLARTLANALRERGATVVTADSAEQATRHLFPGHAFDVVVLDQRLPGESGVDLLERMRAAGQTTPVILMTAYETASMRSRAFASAVAGFFRKPFDLGAMLERIEQVAHDAEAARMAAQEGRAGSA